MTDDMQNEIFGTDKVVKKGEFITRLSKLAKKYLNSAAIRKAFSDKNTSKTAKGAAATKVIDELNGIQNGLDKIMADADKRAAEEKKKGAQKVDEAVK